jgi:thioredoxin 2
METATKKNAVVRCPFCATLNRVDMARVEQNPKCSNCGKPILLDRPISITEADLDRITRESDVPVLVDFYADWCGPCKVMAPVLDQIARDYRGRALIAKLDTDRNPRSIPRFGVRGVPTLIIFRNGAEVAREVGIVQGAKLASLLDSTGP